MPEYLLIFIQAFSIGFFVAMPLGPISAVCIKNTLNCGLGIGIASIIGMSFGDAIYGFLAAGGLAVISSILINYNDTIKIVGGLVLICLGIKDIVTYNIINISSSNTSISRKSYYKTIAGVCILTITNPLTIIAFIAIFTSIGIKELHGFQAVIMVTGVFIGSLVWGLILVIAVAFLRKKMTEKSMMVVNIISGMVLIGFGLLNILK